MNLRCINPGADQMIQHIMAFQTESESDFWTEPLYYFYPQLDRNRAAALPFAKRKDYIESTMRTVYADLEPVINEKAAAYAEYWAICRPQIEAALSDAFGVDCASLFNDLQCHVTMNPIEPRFLREHRFDIFYLNSEKGAIGEIIHELIHFVWFYVWNQLFEDDYEEYERPNLKWILSEMVVEPIMRDPRLSSINPYFPRESGGCVYPYFFDMKADGACILDTLNTMYQTMLMDDFMRSGYTYCLKHEAEIREHIRKSEAQS